MKMFCDFVVFNKIKLCHYYLLMVAVSDKEWRYKCASVKVQTMMVAHISSRLIKAHDGNFFSYTKLFSCS